MLYDLKERVDEVTEIELKILDLVPSSEDLAKPAFTIQHKVGFSDRYVKNKLDALVEEGKVKKKLGYVNKKTYSIYWKA